MSTVYLIYAETDGEFVHQHLLSGLPVEGYGWWLASHRLGGVAPDRGAIARAINQCAATLAVVSPAMARSTMSVQEIEIALAGARPLIAVTIAQLESEDAGRLPPRLWLAPRVDWCKEDGAEPRRLLAALLPPVAAETRTAFPPTSAERIRWDPEILSGAIASATDRHDHARASSLVQALVGHLDHRKDPYPPKQACNDLQALREEREFALLCEYGKAVLHRGTREDRIRRLFAQGLIETGRYARALDELQGIIHDPDSSQREIFEAHGLSGRTFKQRYVEAERDPGAAELLMRAIESYEGVYAQDRSQFWHGVNAASCMLRAERDGIAASPPGRARQIAGQVAEDLDRLSQQGPLEVWDCASRVEALVALDRFDEAERALDAYVHHPAMRAFEVFSTYRQFDQVLELDRDPRGAAIMARLHEAVARYRAGSLPPPGRCAGPAPAPQSLAPQVRPLVIRVGDPTWTPRGVTDLLIESRLGNIITARGSDASVRELLADPGVTSIEHSRPAGSHECARSLPFIRIAPAYPGAHGDYQESGDGALVAIIDSGIDLLHRAFLDAAGNSRILGIWDQNGSGPAPPGFSYGSLHDQAAIGAHVRAGTVPAGLGRDDGGHGTHVASIAAGRATGTFAGGVAPDARLLIVASGGSGPIGYSRSHIEALSFIDQFATGLNLPVVVNLSQGMNAGAHDGRSALEVAFDAFSQSGRRPGRVVVKSAGNERGRAGHAKITLLPDGLEQLGWRRVPGADEVERIELWWDSGDELEFRLCDPSANRSSWVSAAAPESGGAFPESGPYRLALTKRHVDNGDSLLSIELGDAGNAAAPGDWLLEIHAVAVRAAGEVHAWIERSRGVPTSFTSHVDEEMTLSIPATASSVIAVGAVDASTPICVGGFSSYGPTRDGQKKPVVCAPGVGVNAAKGGTPDDSFADSGTSMAAAHVTGSVALLLSRTAKTGRLPGGNQIASALRQKTRNYSGRWDRGQGYGVIDVAALLAAFE